MDYLNFNSNPIRKKKYIPKITASVIGEEIVFNPESVKLLRIGPESTILFLYNDSRKCWFISAISTSEEYLGGCYVTIDKLPIVSELIINKRSLAVSYYIDVVPELIMGRRWFMLENVA